MCNFSCCGRSRSCGCGGISPYSGTGGFGWPYGAFGAFDSLSGGYGCGCGGNSLYSVNEAVGFASGALAQSGLLSRLNNTGSCCCSCCSRYF